MEKHERVKLKKLRKTLQAGRVTLVPTDLLEHLLLRHQKTKNDKSVGWSGTYSPHHSLLCEAVEDLLKAAELLP